MDIVTKHNVFQRQYLRKGFFLSHQHGSSSCHNLGAQGFGNLPDPQEKDPEAGCRNVEKKKSASLDVLMEAENFDFECELRFHRLAAWL